MIFPQSAQTVCNVTLTQAFNFRRVLAKDGIKAFWPHKLNRPGAIFADRRDKAEGVSG
ncbi:MAG TPA: hypothetical protein VI320_08690 [Terracidiphilus sp.]